MSLTLGEIRKYCEDGIRETLEKVEVHHKMVSGAYNRKKGADFERELVHVFRKIFDDEDVKRGLQYRSGVEIPDVECPIFWIEAKRMKRPNIRAALQQACDACPEHRIPLAITKANRDDTLVTLKLDDFVEMCQEWWAGKEL